MKSIKERLKAKGITEKSKFHNYDYLYKSIVEVMQDYEKELSESKERISDLLQENEQHAEYLAQIDDILEEQRKL